MRFISNGPDIPDDLLADRDRGSVLFFCGAGVSRARAGLPDFGTLAGVVLDTLGSSSDSPARILFEETRRFERRSGLSGVMATDRIFGLLDREFDPREVRETVARALKPADGHHLEAHRTLLRLSTVHPNTSPRLVTTNFDLLFEECQPDVQSWGPPLLPRPGRESDFRGIVHLHGRVEPNYVAASHDELILSSRDFGRAYLSDGWATAFFQTLLAQYRIVFVGYSADDPPIRYLLEALNDGTGDSLPRMFAFQAGGQPSVLDQWSSKGVRPLPYETPEGSHAHLWETLEAWAGRADNPTAWYDHVLDLAQSGPAALSPHQRGMVAHLLSTRDGARRALKRSEDRSRALPSTWLYTLDPNERYLTPGRAVAFDDRTPFVDAFELYGLDRDEAPTTPSREGDHLPRRRDVPKGAWDGLNPNTMDGERPTPSLRGATASAPTALAPRLSFLARWIGLVAEQPPALWWAGRQADLHPHLRASISWSLEHGAIANGPPDIRSTWSRLLSHWEKPPKPDASHEFYAIQERAARDGWSAELVQQAVELYNPYISVEMSTTGQAPTVLAGLAASSFSGASVEYPRPHQPIQVPNSLLALEVGLLHRLLEDADRLELQLSPSGYPLHADTRSDGEPLNEDAYGLAGLIIAFMHRFERLLRNDHDLARREFDSWPSAIPIFVRLRIWAASFKQLCRPSEAASIFLSLDDKTFWTHEQNRDLLLSLRDRWSGLPARAKRKLEDRILIGPIPWAATLADPQQMAAYARLERLQWLKNQGVTFGFDVDKEMSALRRLVPDWTEEAAIGAADPNVSAVFSITTDDNPTEIIDLRPSEVLEAARRLEGTDYRAHVHRSPLSGLVAKKPGLVLSAIRLAQKQRRFESEAWSQLLRHDARSGELSRLSRVIAHRLARLTALRIGAIAPAVADWMVAKSEVLLRDEPRLFDKVWRSLIRGLRVAPPPLPGHPDERRWVDEALNRPAGRMVDALMKDPRHPGFALDTGLPPTWCRRIESLLELPGDHRRHALAMIAHQTTWLYHVDPSWTNRFLVPIALNESDDADAFWAGFFWGARVPQPPLFRQLKSAIVGRAREKIDRRRDQNITAAILLSGWGNPVKGRRKRLVSDSELRDTLARSSNEFRSAVLHHLERAALDTRSEWRRNVMPFLDRVWPRQLSVRNIQMSRQLALLAIHLPDLFSQVVPVILPRLRPFVEAHGIMHDLQHSPVVETHPVATANLLDAILFRDPDEWPYGTETVLRKLQVQPGLPVSHRIHELFAALST